MVARKAQQQPLVSRLAAAPGDAADRVQSVVPVTIQQQLSFGLATGVLVAKVLQPVVATKIQQQGSPAALPEAAALLIAADRVQSVVATMTQQQESLAIFASPPAAET